MASIVVMSGTQNEYYSLGQRTYTIGRSENVPIQILDEYVSREHLCIRFDRHSNCYYAEDMGSRHGAFVNGKKIEKETTLDDDDQIRIGDTTILFTSKDFPDSKSALSYFKKLGELRYPTQVE